MPWSSCCPVRLLRIPFFLLVLFKLINSTCCENLLVNSDLEEDAFTSWKDGWYKRKCDATLSSDSHTGQSSAMINNRQNKWAGLAQYVNLEAGKSYSFLAYIKVLNTAGGKLTANVYATMFYKNQTTGDTKYERICITKFMQPNIWQRFGGDLTVPSGYDKMRIYIEVASPDVNYLLDTTSLSEIPPLPADWKTTANAVIDNIRKADINIEVVSGDVSGVSVELVQERSEFAFGTAVSADRIVDTATDFKVYQDFFYENFEWATIENKLKWKQTEKSEGVLTYDSGENAVNNLTSHGIKVRGHAVFWGAPDKDPAWVRSLQGDALRQAMDKRISDVIGRTYGKLEHWDVNNENVHGDFYEEATGDANITMEMFQDVHNADAKPKLFLNDFSIVKNQYSTQAYRSQAEMFRDTPSVPIYGIGIQSHFYPPLDLKLVKHRLDQIADVGLPVWITELDFDEADAVKKAALFDDILRLYFSTQAVEGVILWGFWDGKISKQSAALATGDNVTVNAAGLKWQELVRNEWRTNENVQLDTGNNSVRGFKGDYSLKVIRDGDVIQEKQFVLDSNGANISLNL